MKFNSGAIFDKLRGGAEGSTLNIALYIGLAVFIVLAVVNFLLPRSVCLMTCIRPENARR